MLDAPAPWDLTIWLICQDGRPFDYRFSRAAAFMRSKSLRDSVPSGNWTVETKRAFLVLGENPLIDALRSVRIFVADCIETGHDRAMLGNLYSARDEIDAALEKVETR